MADGEHTRAHAHAQARASEVFFDFVERAHTVDNPDDLNTETMQALGLLGYSYAVAFALNEPGPNTPYGRMLFGKPHDGWRAHYLERRFYMNDAVVPVVRYGVDPVTWSDVVARTDADHPGLAVMEEARAFGLQEGFVSPIHEHGSLYATMLMTTEKLDLSVKDRAAAHLVSIYYMANARRLLAMESSGAAPVDSRLTPRQRECLRWVRDGKTDWEIGRILGISEQTVMAHVKAARLALGVRTRAQAVAEALSRGEIPL